MFRQIRVTVDQFIAAAAHNDGKIVDQYLSENSDNPDAVNSRGKGQSTALIAAAAEGHSEIVQRLLKQPGINPNIIADNGYNALIWAAYNDRIDVVKLLLGRPDIVTMHADKFGNTVQSCLEKSSHPDANDALEMLTSQPTNRASF